MSACVLCRSSEDDKLKFGKLFSTEAVTVHHYCMVNISFM